VVAERAKWGIYGLVTDSVSGEPLWAEVEIDNPVRWHCYTDTIIGDYHKMVPAGVYDIRFWAPGYRAKLIQGVTVPSQGAVRVDCALARDSTQHYGFQVISVGYAWHAEDGNNTQPHDALGPPDNSYFSLGEAGFIIIDMHRPIRDGPGNDLTVHEGDGTAEGYTVYVSNSWSGPWQSLGTGTGTQGFDLGGIETARYVRVVDDGSSTSGPYAGFDLDAIEARYVVPGVSGKEPITSAKILLPSPTRTMRLVYTIPEPGVVDISLFDVTGRLILNRRVNHRAPGEYQVVIDRSGLKSGVYFVLVKSHAFSKAFKVALIR
jgi:hypothetical protein